MEEETKTKAAAEKEEGVVTPEDINNMDEVIICRAERSQ